MGSVWSISSIWFLWFIRLVWFSQTNKIDQMNQINPFRPFRGAIQPACAWLVLACLILGAMSGVISWAEPGSSPPPARPFQVGEQLTYEISWLNITAGTAVMAVSDAAVNGGRSWATFITTAQSRPAITTFFPVDNRVESIVDLATLLPEHLTF